jgi:hypothetical protein
MRSLPAIIFLLIPALASAQVLITEIMYDLREGSDTGREWIEVYNAGSASVDLPKWKVVESGKNHKISTVQGSFGAGTFAVIADNAMKFKADHPAYAGALFDSAFSLNNDGESLALHDAAGNEIVLISYTADMGAKGTGDSLQQTDQGLVPGIPTPGAPVPASGLVRTPQPEKAAKKGAPKEAARVSPQPQVVKENTGEPVRESQVAMTIASETASMALWWFGTAAIAACSAFGVVYARSIRRREWDIIEES